MDDSRPVAGWRRPPARIVFSLLGLAALPLATACDSPSTIEDLEPLEVTVYELEPGVPDEPYEAMLTAVGGDGSYQWSLLQGTLPAGLGLSSSGLLAGTPTETMATPLTVEVRSGDGQTVSRDLLLEVSAGPVLTSPDYGEVLDNGCSFDPENPTSWSFNWEPVSGASEYRIVVRKSGATIALIDSVVTESRYRFEETGGYIIDRNTRNWSWKVQAFVDGAWGPWSVTRLFDVERNNFDCP